MSADGVETPPGNQPTTGRPPLLVLGVGSELRSDDAVGRRVVESVAAWRAQNLEVRCVHQLTPELADTMTGRQLVVVVDACVGAAAPVVTEVEPMAVVGAMTHHLDVAALARLAAQLGCAPRRIVTVGVPAFEFGLGTTLSASAAAAVGPAVDVVWSLCGEPGP